MTALLTDRLVLRPLTIEDAPELFEIRGDPEAMAFWDWPHDPSTDATRVIVKQLLNDVATGSAIIWTVRLRSDETFVGLFDLSEIRPHESTDLGFMLVRRLWGRGFVVTPTNKRLPVLGIVHPYLPLVSKVVSTESRAPVYARRKPRKNVFATDPRKSLKIK